MTGYIWMCDKCNGNGYTMTIDMNTAFSDVINHTKGVVFQYTGGTRILTCNDCSGRGYWEPN
jgi:ribosomal protein L33